MAYFIQVFIVYVFNNCGMNHWHEENFANEKKNCLYMHNNTSSRTVHKSEMS